MSSGPNSVRRGRKFDQVLAGAREVFLRDGFEGASVDDIAREAGVSKATLYTYFPDKRLMFIEVFRAELAHDTSAGQAMLDFNAPPSEVLPMMVQMISEHIVRPFSVSIARLAIGEAGRFPLLAREFYGAGPGNLRMIIAGYLQLSAERGYLDIPGQDYDMAADQILQLAGTNIYDRVMLLGPDSVDQAQVDATARAAVDIFLRAYGRNSKDVN